MKARTGLCSSAVLAFAILALTATAVAQSSVVPPEIKAGLDRITPNSVRANIVYLADDLLEGRAPGTRGGELAAKYIVSRLEAMGLEPGGANGSFYQQVPFREFRADAENCSAALTKGGVVTALKFADDYLTGGSAFANTVDLDAPIVFVGYGAEVPKYKLNDYAGIDVKGKVVAILRGGSPAMPAEERAHYGTGTMLAETAARHGAIGILMLPTPDWEKENPYAKSAANLQSGMKWIGPDGKPSGTPEIKIAAVLSPATSEKLFDGSGTTLAQAVEELKAGNSKSFETPFKIKLHIVTSSHDITSPNIIAIKRGADAKLKDEYLVYSAHYDHLGIGKPVNGDGLYNGAWDNATGVTSLLNIADAFSAAKAPARSVAFVFVTAEEKGLLGSDYFAQYPTIPKDSMLANINIDMIPFFTEYKEIMLGPDRAGVNASIQQVAQMLGLPANEPPKGVPQRGGGSFMTRSDGYSFIRVGVPVISIGLRGDPKASEGFRTLYGTRYHQPSDDLTMPFDWNAGAIFAKANFLLGYEVAQSKEKPAWKAGDWLAECFGKTNGTKPGMK